MRTATVLALVAAVTLAAAAAQAQSRIASAPTVTAAVDGGVFIRFTGLRGTSEDWIGIAAVDSPATDYVTYQYTGGARTGILTFPSLPAGTYVARAYFGSSSYVIRAQSAPFRVEDECARAAGGPPAILASNDGGTAFARFAGLCGAQHEWIAIATVGSASSSYVAWRWTDGTRDGVFTFPGLAPGQYVARVFSDWDAGHSYAVRAESAPFWVLPPGCTCGGAGG